MKMTIFYMVRKMAKGFLPLCLFALLPLVSCSDFSDYNTVAVDGNASATQTLWQNIKQNPQLSDFAALVERAGFSSQLDATHYYTVWAPKNGSFNPVSFDGYSNEDLLQQFVKNHIASYSHQATGTIDERVLMLNEKSYVFSGSASYAFDGINISQANMPSSNGVLHIIDGEAAFYPNLYEFVTDSVLSRGKEIDSLRNFFQKYETETLDEEASVLGPIVNGMQTYVDSVLVVSNALWRTLNASLSHEDSSYTFLMPTNNAWNKSYDKIKTYYNYASTTKAEAFGTVKEQSVNIDNAYWQDSLANRFLTRYMIYSNNDGYNSWLEGTPSVLGQDTLRTTNRVKLSNPQDILAQTKETLKMSNGVVRIVDSLAMLPWETYAPELSASASLSSNRANVLTGNVNTYSVTMHSPSQDDFSYAHIKPTGGYAKPELDLFLPGVLSTTYDIYCVFVPAFDVLKNYPDSIVPPNRVIFTMNYCDANGNRKDVTFLNESEENISSFQEQFPKVTDNKTNSTSIRAFSNDPTRLDTVFVGEFTFPVCYYGLGDGFCPNIKISSPFSVFNKDLMTAFTRDLRIASVILKPKELVEFEQSKKQ